jgi:hypothetical protein
VKPISSCLKLRFLEGFVLVKSSRNLLKRITHRNSDTTEGESDANDRTLQLQLKCQPSLAFTTFVFRKQHEFSGTTTEC